MVGPRLYSCWNCRNHVSLHDDIISKAFQISSPDFCYCKLILFLGCWAKEDQNLMTGLHTVVDVYCEASQEYKEGKFILEKCKIVKKNW
ncbi:Protein yippee-like At4g27745 [Linum perenne]